MVNEKSRSIQWIPTNVQKWKISFAQLEEAKNMKPGINQEFTMEEVATHNKSSDAWIVHESRVYDITSFMNIHPGGEGYLVKDLGKDVTKIMSETHLHSSTAIDILDNFEIGVIKGKDMMSNSVEKSKRQLNREEAGVDMKEPILLQLMNMDPKKYQEWVHIPVIPSETDHLYLFEKKEMGFLEVHTQSKWYFVPLVWIPVIIWRLFLGFSITSWSLNMIWGLLIGMVIWAFTEYYLHGILFHANTEHWITNMIHFSFHGVHHLNPLDQNRLVFPPTIGIIFFALPLGTVANFLFSSSICHYIEIGFLFGYLMYDMTHYYLHHGTWMFGPLKYLKKCHMHHHFFKGGEEKNYGVSLLAKPLDYLFGTNKSDL
jgi:cytochrome b involved in lipid metabolism